MAGIPAALAGQIYHELDSQPAVEATRFSIAYDPPLTPKFGFAGYIGTAKGQAATTIELTFATVAEKSQFNLMAMAAANVAGDTGFTYAFWEGERGISRKWVITNCKLGGFRQENDPTSGDGSKSVRIVGAPPKQAA